MIGAAGLPSPPPRSFDGARGRHHRVWVGAGLTFIFVCLALVGAARAAPADDLRRARLLVKSGQLRQAIKALDGVLKRTDLVADVRIRALETKAIAQYLAKDRRGAETTYRTLLGLEPAHQLDPMENPPEILEFFQKLGPAAGAGEAGASPAPDGSGKAGTTEPAGSGSSGSGPPATSGSGSAATSGSGPPATSGSGSAATSGSGSASTSGSGSAATSGSGSASTSGSGSASTSGSGSASTSGSASASSGSGSASSGSGSASSGSGSAATTGSGSGAAAGDKNAWSATDGTSGSAGGTGPKGSAGGNDAVTVPAAPPERPCGIVLCLVPFGVGQFVNGHPVKGVIFAVLEAAGLAVNIGLWGARQAEFGRQGYLDSLADQDRNYAIQITGFAVFASALVAGVVDAFVFP